MGYGRQLRDWLGSASAWMGEPVEVEYLDSPQDHGVDVLVTGLTTASRTGIQIKSDNDLKAPTFQRELKAQITESQAFGLDQLVVIFACDPGPPNEARIQHFVMESRRYHAPRLVVLPPERAAGLLAAFHQPLGEPSVEGLPWVSFFDETGQSSLVSLYLDRWAPLSPEERFVSPDCVDKLNASLEKHQITCLVGPAATGKTFLAAISLHAHWKKGKPASWIAPPTFQLTEGPLVLSPGLPDARERVEALARQLGLRDRVPPLDATDFVAKYLLPDSMVYIEDPLGKTAAEFTTSLHTYPFFDIDAFVTMLAGATRASARVLITSREGLFDRWLHERGDTVSGKVNIVRLQASDYSFRDRMALAGKLSAVRGNVLSASILEDISRQLETPFEIEQCIGSLRRGASDEQAKLAAEGARQLSLASATSLVKPDTDADRLFLVCLCALNASKFGRSYFSPTYTELFGLLALQGSAEGGLNSAMEKYGSVVTRIPIGDDARPSGFHLDPVHSTVDEAARAALVATCIPFMRSVALALPRWGREPLRKYTAFAVSELLLTLGVGLTQSPEQDAYFELLAFGCNPFRSGRVIVAALAKADSRFRELLGVTLSKDSFEARQILVDANAGLNKEVDSSDAWALALMLLRHPRMAAARFEFSGPPWDWVWTNAGMMPPEFEKLLRERLGENPELVVYAMATSIVQHWRTMPTWMKEALWESRVLASGPTQGRLLIEIARYWDSAEGLQPYFQERATSEHGAVRAAAGVAALVHYENWPTGFEAIVLAISRDANVSVPLEAFEEGLGQEEFCQRFAARLFDRADDVVAGVMFASLLSKNDRSAWQSELMGDCEQRAGKFADAVKISWNFGPLQPQELEQFQAHEPVVTLARLWRYANMSSSTDAVNVEAFTEAILGLPRLPKLLSVVLLRSQWRYLPQSLRARLLGEPGLTMLLPQAGPRPGQDDEEHSRTLQGFPIKAFLKERATQGSG
jgi:hypothetical protein